MVLLLIIAAHAARPDLASGLHPGSAQAPAWSGDGRTLTYEVSIPGSRTVSLYRVAPGAPPVLVAPTVRSTGASAGFQRRLRARVSHEAAWAPAGTDAFVYVHGFEGGDLDLQLDTGGSLAPASGADGGPDWSADGRWIVFTSARSGQGDLYRVDLDDPEAPPVRLTRDPDASELYAAIAPDSRRVAFTAHTPRGDNILLLDDLTQPGAPTVLTPWPGTQVRPAWSPDGRRIAFFASAPGEDRWDLMVVSPGGAAERLAEGVVPGRRGPAWTPDGRGLVFVRDDDDHFDPVYRVSIDGPGTATLVVTGTVGNRDPAVVLRDDGTTWLALSAQGQEGDTTRDFHRIYVQPLD